MVGEEKERERERERGREGFRTLFFFRIFPRCDIAAHTHSRGIFFFFFFPILLAACLNGMHRQCNVSGVSRADHGL